jgi:hypothetical protein
VLELNIMSYIAVDTRPSLFPSFEVILSFCLDLLVMFVLTGGILYLNISEPPCRRVCLTYFDFINLFNYTQVHKVLFDD